MQPIAQPLCVPPPADHNRPPESSTAEALPSCVTTRLKSSQLAASVMLGRWSSCIELFMEVFGERLRGEGEPNTRSLFYQPGKPGFFAIRHGSITPCIHTLYV